MLERAIDTNNLSVLQVAVRDRMFRSMKSCMVSDLNMNRHGKFGTPDSGSTIMIIYWNDYNKGIFQS